MSDKIILVTGGTGFLGKEIVNCLVKDGFSVKVLTRDNSPYINTSNIEYVNGDILDIDSLKKEIDGCYGLIHSAGEKTDASKMQLINVEGTKNICEVANKSDIKYFCFVSSVGVIGLNNNTLINENDTCRPTNTYEKTKLLAEEYVVSNFKKEDCSSVSLRPTNIFGLKHITYNNSFTSKLKRWIKGNEVANYVYVKDVAASCVHFLNTTSVYKNEVFIVNQIAKKYLFKDVYEIVNGKKSIFYPTIYLPWLFRYLKHGKNNLGNKFYSAKKLEEHGFKNTYGVEKGVEDLLN